VVSDDDIEMFARGLVGRYGEDARWRARDQSARLAASGDTEGERVWRRVGVAVEVLQFKGQRPRS